MQQEHEQKPDRRAQILGWVIWAVARLVGMTLRLRSENRETLERHLRSGEGVIVVLWHGRSLVPVNLFRHRGIWALISLSRDGEVQNAVFRRFGFNTIRGSTGRGGARAALQLARIIREGASLAFTPDGPRGPTHRVQPGTIFIAQRSGCPILPLGISARPRRLLRSWDSYMIPLPFARAALVVGEPFYVSSDLDEAGRELAAAQLERRLNAVEKRAEEMLGLSYPAEFPTE
jgi:lysophospholipid acyltransferase (LPLAT)-like uncharacterized protein